MTFDSNAIHGYNPAYRNLGAGTRFSSFNMSPNGQRPVQFSSQPIAGTGYLDHQGHIIPQNNYQARLIVIAQAADHAMQGQPAYDLATLDAQLAILFPGMNFNTVTTYIQQRLIVAGGAAPAIFVDPTENDPLERLNGYFSVINWNPVNICRAPDDNHRNNYPGNGPDNVVAAKLLTDPNNAGITLDANYQGFLQANIGNLLGNVDNFITACNASLANAPIGFYKFGWATLLTAVP
ncbi:hypothetical protein GOZ78_03810 [Agrobacterium vitis]|uniref:Uncharacterized protein n=2 Tax=Agrobacterium vitis TaxID=373 RepID=A0ABD6G6Z7_AGRVI|nr:hypothetical protein [Agrobacterium vitis]MUO77973.1 hypothetical protein [Agrobacterium vitis]MUO96669.1 hypothetical protein [Agrobacterium vitis]MUP04842.1 hypothetical protein [Agrobacterium vitis]MUZ80719.1 hypothetical protein [Agrobacterium vitis]MVA09145.1 hypothetical protein [Agrobacterium vitis]